MPPRRLKNNHRSIGQPQGSTDYPPILTDEIGLPLKGGLPLHKRITPVLVLTGAGQIVEDNWHKIANKNTKTDAFVIMPNHIHGIIIVKSHFLRLGVGLAPTPDLSPARIYGQPRGLPLQNENAPAPNVGSIIGAFKSRSALEYLKFIDANNLNESAKIWQRNYYEHIIRDRKELAAIRNYIKSNPYNWEKDEENPINL